MRTYDLIVKKRDGGEHTSQEIEFFIKGVTSGEIPDYHISAWLMAAFLRGLSREETNHLTRAMLYSGKILNLSEIDKPKVDKHSTGGVGDKISLLLAPAVSACGVAVPMTSGRGLGFTGGTLDKLESIPGYRIDLGEDEFLRVLKKVGFAMTGQTTAIAPADKKLYAIRDVTGTVENIPLITSSILSKKLAEGADAFVFDVKFGSGAFMKTKELAKELSRMLFDTVTMMGRRAVCVLSSMEQPLGKAVGNSLEVREAIDCMKGEGEEDVLLLTETLGSYMLILAGKVQNLSEGKKLIHQVLHNGEAFEKFKQSVIEQGGDVRSIDEPQRLPNSKNREHIICPNSGYISAIDTEKVGTAAVYLGAGRFTKDDSIDYSAGIIVHRKIGDRVNKGEKLCTLYYNRKEHLKQAAGLVLEAYIISKNKPPPFKLIHEVIM